MRVRALRGDVQNSPPARSVLFGRMLGVGVTGAAGTGGAGGRGDAEGTGGAPQGARRASTAYDGSRG